MLLQAEQSLEEALQRCQDAADRGRRILKDHLQEISTAIVDASAEIQKVITDLESRRMLTADDATAQLRRQLAQIVNDLESLEKRAEADLDDRMARGGVFFITLFGRTMAGKSSLMEILRHGDGSSIGKGAQRTTRDVRSYPWKGLSITDVPGTAAFSGEADERVALTAAEQADLVLFLITDDAPQPADAEWFARVRCLGKPVLGILNVKHAISDDDVDDARLFLRRVPKLFDPVRIAKLTTQFRQLLDEQDPNRVKVDFLATHLRARFLADRTPFDDMAKPLAEASRFHLVEEQVVREVISRGPFLRVKSFVDAAFAPAMDLMKSLLEFSAANSTAGRVLVGKMREFKGWAEDLKGKETERIRTEVSKWMNTLRDNIDTFAADHFEDRDAAEKWNAYVASLAINDKVATLSQQISRRCQKGLRDFSHDLQGELEYVRAVFDDPLRVSTSRVGDPVKVAKWGVMTFDAVIGILELLGLGLGPLGWAASVALSVLGPLVALLLFGDRASRIKKARSRLSQSLNDHINRMEENLVRELLKWFGNEIMIKQVRAFDQGLQIVTSSLFALADTQRVLAWRLNDRLKALSQLLLAEVIQPSDPDFNYGSIRQVARVPGYATMLLIDPGTTLPDGIRPILEKRLGERVLLVNNGIPKRVLARAIGRATSIDKISIEWPIKVAHVPMAGFDPETRQRVLLAQQVTGLHIME